MDTHLIGGVTTDTTNREHKLRCCSVGLLPQLIIFEQFIIAVKTTEEKLRPLHALAVELLRIHRLVAADSLLLECQ